MVTCGSRSVREDGTYGGALLCPYLQLVDHFDELVSINKQYWKNTFSCCFPFGFHCKCVRCNQYPFIEVKRDALKMGIGDSLEWLFYNQAGNMLDEAHLRNRIFNKALDKAMLRRIRIHDLRHTYATLRIQAGHNLADVSRQLGHHSIRITVDTYYHWMPGTNSQEVNELDLKSAPKRNLSATNPISPNKKGASQYAITP